MVRKVGAGQIQEIAPSIQLRPLFSHAITGKAKRIAPKPSRKCRNNHEQVEVMMSPSLMILVL
jgi:hypothetical protein